MLVECFITTKCNIEFGVDNYVYEKEKFRTNANRRDTIYARCIKQCRKACKGRIISFKNESVYNVKKSCRDDVHNHTQMMN